MEIGHYMVRAMESTQKDFELFFNNGIVAVGWSKVNFTMYNNINELVEKVRSEYYSDPDISPQWVGKKLNEVRRFVSIKEGDYIVVPFWSAIRLAIAGSKRGYDENVAEKLDLSNQLDVHYLKTDSKFRTIARDQLTGELQSRLRVRGSSVADLYEFSEEIDGLFKIKEYLWNDRIARKEIELVEEFKIKLLRNIQTGKTNLKAGGIGLEHLVEELLTIDGYNAKILPKQTFTSLADADIRASKSDIISNTEALIQVKHHSGNSDDWGFKQLQFLKQSKEYKGDKLILLTSGYISEELRTKCAEADIQTIDGNELVDCVLNSINKLKPETRKQLGIILTPNLIIQ